MENAFTNAKLVFAAVGGFLVGLFGGWDVALKVLVFFVVLDYVTGLAAAWVEQKLNSNVGLRGIAKKILLFVPVAVGYWLDVALGAEVFRSLAIFFYIANEGLSILENLGRAGVSIPAPLKAALEQLRDKADKTPPDEVEKDVG